MSVTLFIVAVVVIVGSTKLPEGTEDGEQEIDVADDAELEVFDVSEIFWLGEPIESRGDRIGFGSSPMGSFSPVGSWS